MAAGAQGLAVLESVAPTESLQVERMDAAGFRLRIQVGPGTAGRLQRSLDLRLWEDWQSVIGTGEPQSFLDDSIAGQSRRFYRVTPP